MPLGFIAGGLLFLYHFGMEQLLKTLSEIGLPDDEVRRIGECYRNDLDGLTHYVMYMRAMLDDRHEYLD